MAVAEIPQRPVGRPPRTFTQEQRDEVVRAVETGSRRQVTTALEIGYGGAYFEIYLTRLGLYDRWLARRQGWCGRQVPVAVTTPGPDERRAKMADMIADGASWREVGLLCGVRTSTSVYHIILREGLLDLWRNARPVRARRAARGVAYNAPAELRRDFLAGMTLAEIGAKHGVTRERIRQLGNNFGCGPTRKEVRRKRLHEQRLTSCRAGIPVARAQAAQHHALVAYQSPLRITATQRGRLKGDSGPRWSYSFWAGDRRIRVVEPEHILNHHYRTGTLKDDSDYILLLPDQRRASYLPPHPMMRYIHVTPGRHCHRKASFKPLAIWYPADEVPLADDIDVRLVHPPKAARKSRASACDTPQRLVG